jgi:excisionase family DNA binding protein
VCVCIIRKLIPISEAAKLLGVHADTPRRWEHESKIKPRRTSGNLRRCDIADIRPILSTLRLRLRVRPWLTRVYQAMTKKKIWSGKSKFLKAIAQRKDGLSSLLPTLALA